MPSPFSGQFFATVLASRSDDMLRLGRVAEAFECARKAIAAHPQSADAFYALGRVLKEAGKKTEAVVAYRAAIARNPRHANAHNNLANLLRGLGHWDEAIAEYRAAIAVGPDLSPAQNNLGVLLKDVGRIDEAMACYDDAIAHGNILAQSNRLYATYFHAGLDAHAIRAAHDGWGATVAMTPMPHANSRVAERRLRVGYVGAHFRDHVQTYFTLPVFKHHDRARFELFCYSDVGQEDRYSAALRPHVNVWRTIAGQSDDEVARQIHSDSIDVLVDLTMHMAGSRLRVFARKPAPVQVTWLAYPGTTGLSAMDYRLSDPHLDPTDEPHRDSLYAEKTFRLPHTFWCFEPMEDALPVQRGSEPITFCCLNNFGKVNAHALRLWGRVLQARPESRFILQAPLVAHDETRRAICAEGATATQIEFVDRMPRKEYLATYTRADIALDTLPYTGHTTTLDALWMGVPVVTRRGETAVARGSTSLLKNLELDELVAPSDDAFVEIARDLSADVPRLRRLQAQLRTRIESSPLMDAVGFTHALEAAYRTMWRHWCGAQAPS